MARRLTQLFAVLLSIPFICNSQVCKLSNNDSVEVFSSKLGGDNKTVIVIVSNDSEKQNVNVTIEVEVTYKFLDYTKKLSYTGKALAKPCSTTEMVIPIKPHWNDDSRYIPVDVNPTSIKGNKCL